MCVFVYSCGWERGCAKACQLFVALSYNHFIRRTPFLFHFMGYPVSPRNLNEDFNRQSINCVTMFCLLFYYFTTHFVTEHFVMAYCNVKNFSRVDWNATIGFLSNVIITVWAFVSIVTPSMRVRRMINALNGNYNYEYSSTYNTS